MLLFLSSFGRVEEFIKLHWQSCVMSNAILCVAKSYERFVISQEINAKRNLDNSNFGNSNSLTIFSLKLRDENADRTLEEYCIPPSGFWTKSRSGLSILYSRLGASKNTAVCTGICNSLNIDSTVQSVIAPLRRARLEGHFLFCVWMVPYWQSKPQSCLLLWRNKPYKK